MKLPLKTEINSSREKKQIGVVHIREEFAMKMLLKTEINIPEECLGLITSVVFKNKVDFCGQ